MKTLKLSIVVIFSVLNLMSQAQDAYLADWQIYKAENFPSFRYPPDFVIDTASFGGPNGELPTQRTCVLTSKKSKLEISASPYGFIPDIYGLRIGFDSPRDILIAGLSDNPHYIKRIKTSDFEIFYDYRDDYTIVYFLQNNPTWGQCYETLNFRYPIGKGQDYKKIIDNVVKSFRPRFTLP